ncbi:unconventional myosin-Va-like [Schistocerca serialis cubense]|uniref:unconventional myosin-Va-like n=1 Tax=Schistocerca serialis cubense TaxID=2023355 RepID=UPI00214F2611|nr:unconventional myosin-Va-like [Schistocerca serialis cubense]
MHHECAEIDHYENNVNTLDQVILGQLRCVTSDSSLTARKHKVQTERKQSRRLIVKAHGNARKLPKNVTSFSDSEFVVRVLHNYAEQHAIILPGRSSTQYNANFKLLPSSDNKAKIFETYMASFTNDMPLKPVSSRVFCNIWKEICPKIVVMKPKSDLCAFCQQHFTSGTAMASVPEETKMETIEKMRSHLQLVAKERVFYKGTIKKTTENFEDGDRSCVRENNALRMAQIELLEMKRKFDALRVVETEKKMMVALLQRKDEDLKTLKSLLENERKEKMTIINEKEHFEKEKAEEVERINKENLRLKAELDKLNERIKSIQFGAAVENLQACVELKRLMLSKDRDGYQKLLEEHNLLKKQNESLKNEMGHLQWHGHSKSTHQCSFYSPITVSAQDKTISGVSDHGEDTEGVQLVLRLHQKVKELEKETIKLQKQMEEVEKEKDGPCGDTAFTHVGFRDGGGDTILTVVSFLFSTSDCSGTATVVVDTISASVACAAAVIGLVAQADSDVAGFDGAAIVTEFDRDAVTICGSVAALVVVSRTYSLPAWLLSLQQLEVENRRLHANMTKLQLSFDDCCSNQTLDDGLGREELLKQYIQLQLEVDRWREECIQLHSILAKQTEGLKNVASINYGSHVHLINEVVELVLAFEAQKKINRQLEDELHQEKNKWQAEREQLQQENEKLREENDNQHKLLPPSLTKSPQTQTEAFMQHEIIRVTSEKLVLQEKLDLAKEELSQCKNSLKLQTEVLKDAGLFSSKLDNNAETAENSIEEVLVKRQGQRNNRRGIRKNERHYQGIFEFHKEDIIHIVRHVIFELKPHIAVTLLPGLPAYILFMCIRHADCQNDYEKVRLLLTATIYTIEKVTKKGHDDIDIMVLWLSNTSLAGHIQEKIQPLVVPAILEHEEISGLTSLIASGKRGRAVMSSWDSEPFLGVQKSLDALLQELNYIAGHIQEKIQPLVVPAILEHEEISGLTSQIASGKRGRAVLSSWDSEPFLGVQKSLDALLQELNYIYKIMGNHGVDPELTVQIFRQVFYFICAISMNNLLLRKDLCHWSKGMQIRYNLSHLEQWCRDMRLQYTVVPTTLQPTIQAAHLLQARKLDEDVQHVCNMCDKLSMLQIAHCDGSYIVMHPLMLKTGLYTIWVRKKHIYKDL